ncbi:MAG: TonB family protein [Labilithrix sp.]|nr:TonB family protein [Labilithrix sp.]MCW5812912.1 TonB family protein [Labilithrix sp.]
MRRFLQATLLVAAMSSAAVARAQEQPPPPAQPVITMPVVVQDDGAKYPPQAIEDKVTTETEVVLVLELDATGAVTRATIDKSGGGHGFDEAALEAAKTLKLEPAKRDGVPIAAKVRHRYVFTPPPAQLIGRVTKQVSDTPIAGATITAVGPDGQPQTTTTADDGTWKLERLPFGKYTITIAASGFDPQTDEEMLDPGTEAKLDSRLVRPEVAPPPPPPGRRGADTEPIEEVTVKGTKPPREVTKRTLEQRELTRIPGTNGDALRAVQNLPGIARAPGIIGLLIVRGAAPQETGTYVDGTFVPIIYHFGGLSSVIPSEMLDHIDFYPGNFSSYFGRHTGGVIDVGVKDPVVKRDAGSKLFTAREGVHGLVQADLIDARFVAQGPIGNTGWNFAVGGRRSYVDVWLKPVLEALESGVTTAPVYYDYQAMLQKSWDKGKHNLRFFFFGSDDRLQVLVRQVAGGAPGLTGNIGLGTAFYRFQARYVGKLSPDTELRAVAAVGKDALQFGVGDNFFNLDSVPITGRIELSQKLGSGARNNFGIDMLSQPYQVNLRAPPIPRPGEPPAGPFGSRPPLVFKGEDNLYRPAFYDELELTPFKGTRIVPGVRLDYTKENKSWDLQPRLVVKQDVKSDFPRTTVKGGVGRFANPPQPQETNPVFGVPGTRSIIANHYGAGVEQQITRNIEVSSEGFYRQYDGIIVQGQGNTGEGRAFGLETLLRYKPDARFFGFVAYTLSRSVRREAPDEPEHLFNFDQTHIFTAIGSYRLGGGWEIGARFRYVSGNLRTPLTYGFFDATAGAYIPGYSFPPFGTRNPAFHQLDLRVDKTWYLQNGMKMSAYLDLYNAYNQGNVEGASYNYNFSQSTFATGVPILPSLGYRLEM